MTGVPANQLSGQQVPTNVDVLRFEPCTKLGSDESTARQMRSAQAIDQAFEELEALRKDNEMPEYLAYDLASQVNTQNVARINDAGYYQEQAGYLRSALIILQAVNARFPKRVVAQLNLADTYWKLGMKGRACLLYASYLRGTRSAKAAVPQRVPERARCGEGS